MQNTTLPQKEKNQIYQETPKKDPLYLGLFIDKKTCTIATYYKRNGSKSAAVFFAENAPEAILKKIREYAEEQNVKFVAAGIMNLNKNIKREDMDALFAELWLKDDIVPFAMTVHGMAAKPAAKKLAKKAQRQFIEDNIAQIYFDKQRKVICSHLVRPSDYKKLVQPEDYEKLIKLAEDIKASKERVVFFSSTPRGGGVALMRHALIRLLNQLGVDVSWHVMDNDNPEIFDITKKKFHNILQGVAPANSVLTEKEKKTFLEWSKKNAQFFKPVFKRATTIIIDDPQPSGMIPYIKKVNPKAKIIYRSHIQIDTSIISKPAQKNTWDFIWQNVKLADIFVSHPIEDFVPPDVAKNKKDTAYMPATTDELDGLNKPLTEDQLSYYLSMFNKHLEENGQTPLDANREYIAQIARFDPSKGIPDVVVSYRTLRERLEADEIPDEKTPQLVIAGHGSIDDPEGSPILEETMHRLNMDLNKKYAKDIKVARLPHVDQLLDALLSKSRVVLQLSHKEGFEIKVSEALAKGKPVIAYKTGGIPLQIEDEVTGYLVPVGNTSQVAEHLYNLCTNDELYNKMSSDAETRVKREYFTVGNASRWMELVLLLSEK